METSVVSVKRSAVASALNEGMPNSKNASVEQSVIMEEGPTQDAVTNGGDDSQNFDDDKLTIYEVYFKSTPGPPEILTVIILMAFGYGAVVSVVSNMLQQTQTPEVYWKSCLVFGLAGIECPIMVSVNSFTIVTSCVKL